MSEIIFVVGLVVICLTGSVTCYMLNTVLRADTEGDHPDYREEWKP